MQLDSDRTIAAGEVTIAGQPYALKRADAPANGREVWTLATSGTPLASVADKLSYSIQVHDAEGQTLERPLEGSIGIEPDLPPGIMVSTKTPIVLPTGSPNIHYEAADDHALGRIWLTWEATADDASPAAESREGGAHQQSDGTSRRRSVARARSRSGLPPRPSPCPGPWRAIIRCPCSRFP